VRHDSARVTSIRHGVAARGARLPQHVRRRPVVVEHDRMPALDDRRVARLEALDRALHVVRDDAEDEGVREDADDVRQVDDPRRARTVLAARVRACNESATR
jgi:hypothetical protein